MSNTKTIAVVTGDLVHSTELGAEKIERAFSALEASAKLQAKWHGAPLRFSRHRGDGWQVVLSRPKMALRSALTFRAALRALGEEFDSYMGVAEGKANGDIKHDLNDETGPLFIRSGELLETAKSPKTDTRLLHKGSTQAATAAYYLADHISRAWTQPQAEAMLFMLDPDPISFTDIAKALGKSRQAVTKSLISAGLQALTPALIAMEDAEDTHA